MLLVCLGCSSSARFLGIPPARRFTVMPFATSRHFNVDRVLTDRTMGLHWPSIHRARAGEQPDNSIKGIELAAQAGAPLIEIELRRTDAGALILFHDSSVRSTNATIPDRLSGRKIESLSDEELGTVRLRGRDQLSIPTFRQVLDAVKPYNSALELDLKSESPQRIDALVAEAQSSAQIPQIVVQCHKLETLAYVRGTFPKIMTIFRAKSFAELQQSYQLLPQIVEFEGWYAPEAIAEAHFHGIKVLVSVAGSIKDNSFSWKAYFSEGVDIIRTNRLEAMIEFFS